MSAATTELVAITVTYNSATVLDDFLASVAKQPRGRFRTLIIDNASTDSTRDRLRQIDDAEIEILLLDSNVGVAAANNIGLRRAIQLNAKTVLLINNDVVFNADLYPAMTAWTDRAPDAAISPVIPYHAEPDLVWFAGGQYQWWRGFIGYHLHHRQSVSLLPAKPYLTEYAPTTCLAFPLSWLEQLGFQDEIYFIYWEDTDFARRMIDLGKRIMVDPEICLLHKVSVSTGGPSNQVTLRYIFRNHMIFLRKFHGVTAIALALIVVGAKVMARLLTGAMTLRQLQIATKAVIEGLTTPLLRGTSK